MRHTINVQATCNERGVFTVVDVTWPDSVHDAKVFAISSLYTVMRGGLIRRIHCELVPGQDSVAPLLLAD